MIGNRTVDARPFAYCFDRVCVAALILYAANRWLLKASPLGSISFFRDYLNDLLCIPLFLPPVLLLHRVIGQHPGDGRPRAWEILLHLAVWSICFEIVAPLFPAIFATTADPLDVVAYSAGAGIAGLCWGSWKPRRGGRCAEASSAGVS